MLREFVDLEVGEIVAGEPTISSPDLEKLYNQGYVMDLQAERDRERAARRRAEQELSNRPAIAPGDAWGPREERR